MVLGDPTRSSGAMSVGAAALKATYRKCRLSGRKVGHR
jgi:hypothetical protein